MLAQTALAVVVGVASIGAHAQTYTATYTPDDAPDHSEGGQSGTNRCGTGYSQTSMCQNAFLNSVDDFCFFAPPEPGPNSVIGDTERIEVAWCMQGKYGTRIIPDGTIQGAHFVQTPDYVQITGIGDLTKVNVPAGDAGGELDPHGADGNGNPIGGLVFSSAFGGSVQQLHEWTNFMSDSEFCFRGCKDGKNAPRLCQHIYDVMGCQWNMPGDYDSGSFDVCKGDTGEPMGVYGTSTFHQGDPATPAAHPAPPTSACTPFSTIANHLDAASSASGSGAGVTSAAAPSTPAPSASASSPSSSSASASASASSSPSGASSSGQSSVAPSTSSQSSALASSRAASGSGTPSRSGSASASAAAANQTTTANGAVGMAPGLVFGVVVGAAMVLA
ncbi:hypothetical protein OF83DRAFT_1196582 [Amylostereum chailletii]|nr:hypothetical protein OF83DRAFT_1196582 [Amylostereum chailletii]